MSDGDAAGQRGDGSEGAVPQWVLDRITDDGVLSLGRKGLGGQIPPWVCQLTDLRGLNLAGCRLAGMIPAELGQLTNLTSLRLDGNQLTGTIPAELGQLTNLTSLWLDGNQLTGTIPAELGELANLTHLGLSRNQLTGTIPAELGELTNLTVLRLDENRLTGTIPPELGKLTNLTGLGLNQNRLMGTLPRKMRRSPLEFLTLDLPVRGLSPRHRRLVARSIARLGDEHDEEIAETITAGESRTVEFKATLRVNLETGKRDRRMEHEVLKNIAAFLNTAGGTLIIGVKDDGTPLGLDRDGFASEDQMQRSLSGLVRDHIGASAWGNIVPEFASYQGKRVFVIRCTKSKSPVHLGRDDEFYIRTSSAVEQLKTREYKKYVDDHF